LNRFARALPSFSIAGLVMLLILLLCAALVIYPVVFIVAESINVGEPGVFPPGEISLHNFAGMAEDVDVLVNTLLVAFGATIMAVVIGFVLAWILTRTNIPGRTRLERSGKRRLWSECPQAAARGCGPERSPHARSGADERLCGSSGVAAVRRPAAAYRDGAGDRVFVHRAAVR
jgi:hypothetical protein